MSILGNIMSSIFGSAAQAAPAPTAPAPTAPAASPGAGASTSTNAEKAAPISQVDVAATMDKLAAGSKEDLDWRKSIVDLMKLLDLDSSLKARKELASELKYTGNTKDSAAMNVWLHRQVMTKLAENGGKVPDDVKRVAPTPA